MRTLWSCIWMISLLVFSCEYNDINANHLSGKWKWTSTCGGFTGLCAYPTANVFKIVEMTGNNFTESTNGSVTFYGQYVLKNKMVTGAVITYQLDIGNQVTWQIELTQNSLLIHKGDITETYQRY